MKKLTWALLSLMLFLGLGTAFAENDEGGGETPTVTLPTPVFDPAGGTVQPGASISIGMDDMPSEYAHGFVFLFYTFNDADNTLETTVDKFTAAASSWWQGGSLGFSVAVAMGEEWEIPCAVPEDAAQGENKLRARLVVAKNFDPTSMMDGEEDPEAPAEVELVYGPIAQATYTVEGEVAALPSPTFDPVSGTAVESGTKVALHYEGEEDESSFYVIYYVLNNPDFDFSRYTMEDDDLEAAAEAYDEGTKITITAATTIKAALGKRAAGGGISWSEPATASYTIKGGDTPDDPTPATKPTAPTFDPDGGEVVKGSKITLTNGYESDATPKKIYYNYGSKTAANLTNIKTETELNAAGKNGVASLNAANEYKAPITINTASTYNAATADIDADGNVTWSDVITKSFTIKVVEPTKPAAPVFNPDGGTVTPGQKITLTQEAGEDIYYCLNGEESDFLSLESGEELGQAENSGQLTVYSASEGIQLTESATVLAAAVQYNDDESITWSDIISKEFTVAGGDNPEPGDKVAQPVITPDNTVGSIKLNQKVTIECATTGASIYYTLDGTAPDASKTLYEGPFLLPESTPVDEEITIRAIAILDGVSSDPTRVNLMVEAAGELPDDPTPPTPVTKPATPTFEPASGATVDFGAELTISCATEDAMIYYTTNGENPDPEAGNGEYCGSYFGAQITASVIKAIAFVYVGEDDILKSDVATATYTINPIKATLSLVPMKEDSVGKNVGTGVEFSIDGWDAESYAATVYYTVDGTTAPSKEAYAAQTDKENGAIKMLSVEWEENGMNKDIVTTDGHALAITFKEATRLKAIGYMTVGGQNVVTPVLDTMLQIKSAAKPTFSLAAGTVIKTGDSLVIKNPVVLPAEPDVEEPEDWDDEEGWKAYDEAWNAYDAAVAAAPKIYYSFDGTEPTSAAYDRQPFEKYEEWSVFKVDEGENVTIYFKEDAQGLFAHVPDIIRSYPTSADTLRLPAGITSFTLKALAVATEQGEGGGPAPLDAKASGASSFMYASDFAATTIYTVPVKMTFDPASGAEVDENTAVAITCSDATAEIFYMMFESEEAAKAAAWNQEKALSYSDELKPVLSLEKTTIKAAYAPKGAETVMNDFFYATYKVKELPAIELTFNPASGSEVDDNTTVTVTASRETEIFYNVYADKAAADADKETFMANAKEVKEDGMPVIKKGNTYLRCAVTDRGEMKYFDATYKVRTANEGEELAGVTVYPNPSNGMFNLELPCAATVEVFASNGVMVQRLTLAEGNATLNIERSGIYFLRITGEGRTTVKRLIIR